AALARALVLNPDERLATAREMRSALCLWNRSERGDSSAGMGQEPRNDLSIEEPDISILTFETVPNLDSTFAGQAISTDDFSSRPAPRSESATTLPKGRILWVAQTARTFIGFLILVSAFLAYLCWNSEQVERSDKPYPPRAAA